MIGLTLEELLLQNIFWFSLVLAIVTYNVSNRLEKRFVVDYRWTNRTAKYAYVVISWIAAISMGAVVVFFYNVIGPVFEPGGGR